MNCETCKQLLLEHMLGELDPATAASVDHHLDSGCTDCLDELRSISGSVDQLVQSLDLVEPEHPTWFKVEKAIGTNADHTETVVASSGKIERAKSTSERGTAGREWVRVALAVACGFLLMLGVQRFIENIPSIQVANETMNGDSIDRVAPDFETVRSKSTSVSFHQPGVLDEVAGVMMFDLRTRQIHVNVEMPVRGRYQVWFVTEDQQSVSGGELDQIDETRLGKIIDIPDTETPIRYAIISSVASETNQGSHTAALVSDLLPTGQDSPL